MSIYRSDEHRDVVRSWCRARLNRPDLNLHLENLNTDLGETNISVVGERGPWLIVVPAAFDSAATVLPPLLTLASEYRVVVIDIPGEPGLSNDIRPHADLVTNYGDWIDDVISSITTSPVRLLGDGMGATIALCARSPQIAELVAVSPEGINNRPDDLRTTYRYFRWKFVPSRRNTDKLLRLAYGTARPPHHVSLVQWFSMLGHAVRPSHRPAPLPNAELAAWRDRPHRVVVGEHDVVHPAERLRRPVRMLMNSELVVTPGTGELLLHEHPGAVRDVIHGLSKVRNTNPDSRHLKC